MIHILHLEDDPIDSQLAADLLQADGLEIAIERVHTLPSFKAGLERAALDLILSDYTIPGMNALDALRLAHETRPEVPFVFLSGTIGDERAIETLKTGATDYVLKDHSSRLVSAVRRALDEASERAKRKAGEHALARTTARLDGIISSAMDGIISMDDQQRIVLFNPAAEKMFEIKAEEALGKKIGEFIPGAPGEGLVQRVEKFGCTGASIRSTGELGAISGRRTNGEEFPIEASISQTEVGGERHFTIILRDITFRRRSEEALQQSEERLRLFIEHAPAAIAMFDNRMHYLSASRRWLTNYHLPDQSVVGRSHYETFPESERWREIHRRSLAGAVQRSEEEQLTRVDGTVQWIRWEVRPWYGSQGSVGGIIIFSEEITQRKLAEAALRESEEKFRTLADNMSQFAWMADHEGRIFWYNKRWFEYTGTTLEEMQGRGWQQVHHPDHAQRVAEKIRNCFQTGEAWEDTFPLRGHDGQYRWFLSRAVPIRDESGRVVRWFGTNTDITAQKDLETGLEQLVKERTARLEQAMEDLQHFSFTITHDMRAPLRAMRGYAEIVLQELSAESMAHNYLKRITSSTERMDELITDALNYSKLTSQKLESAPVDVGALVEEIVDTYPNFQRFKEQIHISKGMLPVLGNKAALTQCFANLLNNAIKFAQPNRAPEVWVRCEEVHTKADEGSQDTGRIRFWVEDNGIGIPEEYLDRIFIMFERLNMQREGTGIGLALVKKAAERMGGRVGVESKPGVGSRFWLELTKATRVG